MGALPWQWLQSTSHGVWCCPWFSLFIPLHSLAVPDSVLPALPLSTLPFFPPSCRAQRSPHLDHNPSLLPTSASASLHRSPPLQAQKVSFPLSVDSVPSLLTALSRELKSKVQAGIQNPLWDFLKS